MVGCQTENVFNVKDKIDLKGDYSKAETIDFLDENISYIPNAKMICSEHQEYCLMVMEIDYKQFYEELKKGYADCGIDMDKLEELDSKDITLNQIDCLKNLAKGLGFGRGISP